jgi:hypothetical protein
MKTGVVLLAALLLGACSPGDSGNKPKMAEQQRQALDQAKGVQDTLQQSAQQQQQEIDKQAQ